ncbi:MAG: hypothetical protein EAZ30_10540 [Betaproteobacteria bacterium]|nr:MAG: hypothetical protein EAZ30_10540 [Betaproteobacteria bacterium]
MQFSLDEVFACSAQFQRWPPKPVRARNAPTRETICARGSSKAICECALCVRVPAQRTPRRDRYARRRCLKSTCLPLSLTTRDRGRNAPFVIGSYHSAKRQADSVARVALSDLI